MKRIVIESDPFRFRVSKPGFDAASGAEDDMLMSLSTVPVQILIAGKIFLTNAAPTQVVPLPVAIPTQLVIDMQVDTTSGVGLKPTWTDGSSYIYITAAKNVAGTEVTFTKVGSSDNRWVAYLIAAKAL